jgi:transcriptional regulator with XRE-family HTH domain
MEMRMRNDLTAAVKELRLAVGDTQQDFAQRLGLAISTVVRYERSRPPKGKALAQMAEVAESIGHAALAQKFAGALDAELIHTESEIDSGAVRALVENRGKPWLLDELKKLIKEAKNGHKLAYPPVFSAADGSPNQNLRISYLEDLLKDLKGRTATK